MAHDSGATRRCAVLFDLDGTLLDSNLSIRSTMNAVLAERGLPVFTKPELDALIGTGLREILARKLPAPDPLALEQMTQRYRDLYTESGWVTVGMVPGLSELLVELQRAGHGLAVVTSKGQHETEALLADLGVSHFFAAVVGDDDVRAIKPHPAPVLEACRQLRCDPAGAIMVGDTQFDILAAKGAKSGAVGVLWGNGSRQGLASAGADAVVSTVPELARFLRAWLKAA